MTERHFALDVDIEQLESAQFRFAQVAGDIDTLGRGIVEIPAEISAQEWSGKARDMACSEMVAIGSQVTSYHRYFARMVVAMKMITAAVRAAEKEVKALNQQWDNMLEDRKVAARKNPVSSSSSVNAVESNQQASWDEGARLERAFAEVKDGLRQQFKDLAGKFEYEVELPISVEQRARMVSAGVTLSGVGSGTGQAATLQDETEAELAAVMPLVRVRVAREDAAAAEAALDRAMKSSDPDDIAEFNAIADRHSTDQAFQIELVKAVGVKKFVTFGDFMREHGGRFDRPDADMRAQTITHIGTAIVRAGNPAYDGDLPGFYSQNARDWRPSYYAELKTAGRTRYTAEAFGVMTEDPNGHLYGYQILGEYLSAGGQAGARAGEAMAGDVGVDMISWDREGLAANEQWSASQSQGLSGQRSMLGKDTSASVDPIAGLLATVDKDKYAAQELLLHKFESPGKAELGVEYLMDPRRAENVPTWLDPNYGKHLGEAIYVGDGDRTNARSTEVAQFALKAYAEHLMKKSPEATQWSKLSLGEGLERVEGESTYGDERPGLRVPLALVTAHHIEDVQFSSQGTHAPKEDSSTQLQAQGVYQVALSEPEYHAILHDFAADRPEDLKKLDPQHLNAAQIVTGAQLAYGAAKIEQYTLDPEELVGLSPERRQTEEKEAREKYLGAAVIQQDALTETVAQLGGGLVSIGKEKDEAEAFSKALVEKGVGMVPVDIVTKAPGIGMVIGMGWEFASQNIIETAFKLDAEKQARKSASEFSSSTVELHLAQAEQGYTQVASWSGEFSPEAWARHPDNHRREGPGYSYEEEKFFDDNGNIIPIASMTDKQFDAYCNWRDDDRIGAAAQYNKLYGDLDERAAKRASKPEDKEE